MSRLEKLAEMLEKSPDEPFLHFGLAMELVKAGLFQKALDSFGHALERDAGYVPAYYHKANTLIALGRQEEARKTLTAGIRAASASGNAHAQSEMQGLLDAIRS